MSNIEKRYWRWDEDLNQSDFKLGDDINKLLDKGLVVRSVYSEKYNGINETPWILDVDADNKINAINYREKFFSLNGEDISSLHLRQFELKMDSILERADVDEKGDKLITMFRDFYLAVVILKRDKI